MHGIQFSLPWTIVFAVVCSMAFAAQFRPLSFWGPLFEALVLLILLNTDVGAILLQGQRRAFWLGFALFGWSYYMAVIGPLKSLVPQPLITGLVTSSVWNFVHYDVSLAEATTRGWYTSGINLSGSTGVVTLSIPEPVGFQSRAEFVWTLMVGWLGGWDDRALPVASGTEGGWAAGMIVLVRWKDRTACLNLGPASPATALFIKSGL